MKVELTRPQMMAILEAIDIWEQDFIYNQVTEEGTPLERSTSDRYRTLQRVEKKLRQKLGGES